MAYERSVLETGNRYYITTNEKKVSDIYHFDTEMFDNQQKKKSKGITIYIEIYRGALSQRSLLFITGLRITSGHGYTCVVLCIKI